MKPIFLNAVEADCTYDSSKHHISDLKKGVCMHVREYKLTIMETLELESFPFDAQELPIKL